MPEHMQIHAFRMVPGEDLKKQIDAYVQLHRIEAGWIMTCVGSLTHYHLRFANQEAGARGKGHFEILSLVGTVSINGLHLHLCQRCQTNRSTRAPSSNPFPLNNNTPGVLPTSRLPSVSSKPSAAAPFRVAHSSSVSKGT